MSRIVLAVAFVLGLVAVLWVGVGFVGTSALALAMSVVIGAVYVLGAMEIRRFRAVTASLQTALSHIPQPLAQLGDWLAGLHPSVQNAVRARVEGERVALPGLALTPYLVGLLVMLGMLGTFVGMVVTFKGAVFALDGSTDLQAIRSALAAPIKGLGLAFGTSVAGVAASAMLGLMSAISRRERLGVVRLLDAQIATTLRPFSLAHQRQESFKALQSQAQALPAVVTQLQALMAQIEQRSEQLDAQLLSRQAKFHSDVSVAYTGLASAVATSLQDSLSASARVAGESLKPVVESAMAAMAEESARQHGRVSDAVQTQLNGLATQFGATATTVADTWTSALAQHAHTSEQQVSGLDRALNAFTHTFEERATALLASVQASAAQSLAGLAQADQHQQAAWTQSLQTLATTLQGEWQQAGAQTLAQQQAVCQALEHTATTISERVSQQAGRSLDDMARLLAQSEELVRARTEAEARWAQDHGQRMDALATLWRTELAALRSDESTRGQAAVERMEALQTTLAGQLAALRTDESARGQAAVDRLEALQTTLAQQLTALRTDESTRGQAAVDRLQTLQTELSAHMGNLRTEEAARGEAAVNRLGELQGALASHLATLGTALEAPMTRLLETASEAPRAAAEVIAQLRQEMGHITERDNLALQERTSLVAQLDTLLHTVQQATGEQRAAIESLVASAATVMEQASGQFAQTLGAQAGRVDEVAAHVNASAVELASLGESFGHGVQLFSASNQQLMDSLQRIEGAIQQSMARSDDQLGYYVAQAREVIDLSISAQQGIVEDLRRLHGASATQPVGAAG